MITKGIRGAITVDENTEDAIRAAILELLGEMFRKNDLTEEKISHIIFTVTHDLNAAFPAKFARLDMGLSKTAMMCFNELDVPGALSMCIRALIVTNCTEDFAPEFVYLKGAEKLRK